MSRFTKIAADGAKLADDATEWVAVLDNTTGLIWTVEETKGMPWKKAQAAVKKLDTAGFKDWRLPTVEELFLLADRTKHSPAIDTAFFPKCKSDWYWTSTPAAYSPGDYAWVVDFDGGGAGWLGQGHDFCVRAVRASQTI
jgi:Protein of unknown function (DUF1566)